VNVDDAGCRDRCKFGKWLHGTPELRHRRGFDEIAAMHARFHEEASRILQLAISSRKDEARKLMDSTSVYTQTSAELTRALQAW
jgi:hypothetical protein